MKISISHIMLNGMPNRMSHGEDRILSLEDNCISSKTMTN